MEDNIEVASEVPAQEVIEKSLTTSQVNDIVKREKARAAERTRQELEAAHKAELERVRSEMGTQATGTLDPKSIKQEVMKELMDDFQERQVQIEREREEARLKDIADQYYLKMGKGSQLFEDFNEVMADFEPASFPNAVMLAASMEHTPEIMYELANNPSKLMQIDGLARQSPNLAKKELERLSNSIRQNLEAKTNNVSAPPPLSRLKSSSVGADSGKMSLKDYKNAPWLRG